MGKKTMATEKLSVLKSTNLHSTGGAHVQSPVTLISGTAVPALSAYVNTAILFGGVTITPKQILDFTQNRKEARVRVVERGRRSRRAKRASETRPNFDMMPASPEWLPSSTGLLRAVRTPLATKAQEEMSDFEREYPW